MNSGRLSEESIRAIRTFFAYLSEKLAEEQGESEPPPKPSDSIIFQYLLASAKPPREDQDNIDDIHECFNHKKLEPVLPLEPPTKHDRWELMAGALSNRNAEYLRRKDPSLYRGFRRKQVRVYWMYVDSVKRDFRALYGKVLNFTREDEQMDAFEVHERRFRMEWLLMRLRMAGAVYLVNGRAGERMSSEAIAELRPMFSAYSA